MSRVKDAFGVDFFKDALEPTPTPKVTPMPSKADKTVVIQRMSDVQESPVEWLWPERIPLGMLTIITGNPRHRQNKFFVRLELRARQHPAPASIFRTSPKPQFCMYVEEITKPDTCYSQRLRKARAFEIGKLVRPLGTYLTERASDEFEIEVRGEWMTVTRAQIEEV